MTEVVKTVFGAVLEEQVRARRAAKAEIIKSSGVIEAEEERADDWQPSITWLNFSGDVTITWDEQNKEAILEYARQKMDEGYSFYIIKPKKMFGFERDAKQKVTEKNFDKLAENSKGIVIPDKSLNDLINAGVAQLKTGHKQEKSSRKLEIDPSKRVRRDQVEKLLESDSLALKPIVGG